MDAVGPAGSIESVPCTELRKGVGWTADVVLAGASAEPSLTTVCKAKTEAKSLLASRKAHPRHAGLSTVGSDAETGATNLLEVAGRPPSLIRGPCARKLQKNRQR